MHLVSRQVDLGLTGDLLWLCTHKAPLSDFAHHLPLTIHPFRGLDTDKSIDKWKKDFATKRHRDLLHLISFPVASVMPGRMLVLEPPRPH